MKTLKINEVKDIIDFILSGHVPSYDDAYYRALEILKEDPAKDWTRATAIEKIRDAVIVSNQPKVKIIGYLKHDDLAERIPHPADIMKNENYRMRFDKGVEWYKPDKMLRVLYDLSDTVELGILEE
jgi:hypothetical protein